MQFVTTGDGSKTLYHPEVGEHYHSKHGAWQESQHVFLNSGLKFFLGAHPKRSGASILEIGFGTGLNFLLTADFATNKQIALDYCGIEAFPLPLDTIRQTGYNEYVAEEIWNDYLVGYEKALTQGTTLNPTVDWQVAHQKVLDFVTDKRFDVIYFDAFAAVHQPDMWTDEVLAHVTSFLHPGGVFVTYAITGNLKRSMKTLGFTVEKAPGAPGKREMLRALKNKGR